MMSYVKNPVGGGGSVSASPGGIVGSCNKDWNLFNAEQLATALMLQLRLTDSGIGRFNCRQQHQQHHHQQQQHQHQQQQQQLPLSFCCVPTSCKRYLETPIRLADHRDAVRVICSNQDCTVGRWMHVDCFRDWEQLMTMLVKSCVAGSGGEEGGGRGNGWNEGSAEKRLGLELALRACVCLCGKGYVRKDVAFYEPLVGPGSVAALKDKTKHLHHHHHHPHPQHHHHHQQQQQPLRWGPQCDITRKAPSSYDADQAVPHRLRTHSFSSTGSSPTSSTATPPPISPRHSSDRRSPPSSISTRSPTPTAEMTSSQPQPTTTSGNIFRHRNDLSTFRRALPRTLLNSYHIKVEDDGPHGNDKIRSFLLTNLTRNRIRQVHCAVCACALPIFDEFPLIDGTFFLSPRRYADDSLSVVFERRAVYLNSVCISCLDASKTQLMCRGCLTPWDGSSFILGTMYSYDVFAAMSCCRSRLACSACQLIVDDPQNLRFFSEFSRLRLCPHCQVEDYHFLKPLSDIFFFKTS